MEEQLPQQRQKSPYALAFLHSLGVVVYVTLVALLMHNGDKIFGTTDTVFTVIAVLMLFTVSAAIVGSLIFARPLLMALNGKKKEALQFAIYTIAFLVLEAIVFFVVLAITS